MTRIEQQVNIIWEGAPRAMSGAASASTAFVLADRKVEAARNQ
jgi:hypothetical protein